jgi:hypothetical protein
MFKRFLDLLEDVDVNGVNLSNAATLGKLVDVKKYATTDTINWYDKTCKRTALYRACARGHYEVVKYLLTWPQLKINFASDTGATPFMLACQEGCVTVVRLLMAHPRCDINLADENRITPFSMACRFANHEIIRDLLDDPRVNLGQWDSEKLTTIDVMIQRGEVDVVKCLLASHRTPYIDCNHVVRCQHALGLTSERRDKMSCLMNDYLQDPQKVKMSLRLEKAYQDYYIPRLYALTILFADHYLRERLVSTRVGRFFRLVSRLPVELQAVLCHRAAGSMGDVITAQTAEQGFQWVVLRFHVNGF